MSSSRPVDAVATQQADQADSPNGFRSILIRKRSQLIRGALAGVVTVTDLGMEPLPRDSELISLFECEPVLTDPDVPWVYNRLRFSLARSNGTLDCDIEPANRTLEVAWTQDGESRLHLVLRRVRGLEIRPGPEREYLLATFLDDNLEPLQLQTKPTIAVHWSVRDEA